MQEIFLEKVLVDIKYQVTSRNKNLIESVLNTAENDINYVWTKIMTLKESLAHVMGYIGLSDSKKMIKITYDNKNVSEDISKEFYEITDKWASKYKIKLDYDFEKEVFYIK